MFTGIVQALGTVRTVTEGRLSVAVGEDAARPWTIGESIAVNGVCLTLVSADPELAFDLSQETLRRTALGDLSSGDPVNLERALLPTDAMGGHFVLGHVDTVGQVEAIEESVFTFRLDPEYDRYLVDKGSVAVDGISLTVVRPAQGTFSVAVIPHTLNATNLGRRRTGDRVNVELDILAKHVEKLITR